MFTPAYLRYIVAIIFASSLLVFSPPAFANHTNDFFCLDEHLPSMSNAPTSMESEARVEDDKGNLVRVKGPLPPQTTIKIAGVATATGQCVIKGFRCSSVLDTQDREVANIGVWKDLGGGSYQLEGKIFGSGPSGLTYYQTLDGWDTSQSTGPQQAYLVNPGEYKYLVQNKVRTTFCEIFPEELNTWVEVDVGEDERDLDCPPEAGNPCNVATGNKHQTDVDYTDPGSGLSFARTYNSILPYQFGIGRSWVSDNHIWLELVGTTITARRPNGAGEPFTKNGSDWEPPPDSKFSLVEDATGFTLTLSDGASERYDLSGNLTSKTDRVGKTTTYGYNGSGQVDTVTGPFGHQLTFTYSATGDLETMTDPASGATTYAYDALRNLTTVTYPDSTVRTYHYEDSNNEHALTGITDENSDRFASYAYDASSGQVTSSEHAQTSNGSAQERVTLSYPSATQTTVTDAAGTVWTYDFQEQHDIKRLTGMSNSVDSKTESTSYDANNNLISRTDEEGRTTTYTYNATNQRISMTEASGTAEARTTTYEYLSADEDLVTKVITPSVASAQSKEVVTSYDANRNVTSITENGYRPGGTAVSRVTSMQYNANGQITQIDGPRTGVSDITTLEYYECTTGSECGQLKKVTNALGHITTYDTYDAHGRITQMTDPNDLVTTYTYDARGQLLTVTQTPPTGSARTTTYTYDLAGQLATVATPMGSTLTYDYDEAHDLRTITDNLGNEIRYAYDLKGNRTDEDVHDPQGALVRTVDRLYDIRNQLDSMNAAGSITDVLFDATGNLLSETDPNSNTTSHSYDALSRLEQTIDALSGTTDFSFDENDQTTAITAPNNALTTYTTDDLGNQLSEVSPDRGTITYTYDATGNVLTRTDARGKIGTFTYDALNRVLTESYPDGETITYTYDTAPNGKGQIASLSDQSGSTSWEYSAFGEVTKSTRVIAGQTFVTSYGYDANGRMTSMTYPSGKVVAYTWTDDRITALSVDTTTIFSGATYEPFGPANGWSWGNGGTMSRSFDQRGLLTSHSLAGDIRTLTYDAAGMITDQVDTRQDLDYAYDDLNRLTDFTKGAGTVAPLPNSQVFTYDANGNRTSINENGMLYNYSVQATSNRLLSTAGPVAKTITHDAAGNITTDGTHTYSYSDRGRLISVDSGMVTYQYNGLGERTKKDTSTDTLFVYDELGQLTGEYDNTGALIAEHVHHAGAPVALLTNSGSFYVHTDHLGTPRVITDGTNTVVWRWESDPFGSTAAQEDPDGDSTTLSYNLRFPGQYFNEETSQHYNYFRSYDPSIAQYGQSDPIGLAGGINTFVYVLDDPINRIDPYGLDGRLYIYRRYRRNPKSPGFISPEGHVGYGRGVATVECCDENGDKRTMLFEKKCGGLTLGMSAVGGIVGGLNGPECRSGRYEGYFLELSGGEGFVLSFDIGMTSSASGWPNGFSGVNEGGAGIGIGLPFGVSLCSYTLLQEYIEPGASECRCK